MRNSQQIKSLVSKKKTGMHSCGSNLMLSVGKKRNTWYARVQNGKSRKDVLIGQYPAMPLADARAKVAELVDKIQHSKNCEPAQKATLSDMYYRLERKLPASTVKTTSGLFKTYISPSLGEREITSITASEIYDLIDEINKKGFKTPAENSVKLIKRIYRFAGKLQITDKNPAVFFDKTDTGNHTSKRRRTLSMNELEVVFSCLRKHKSFFSRQLYLAFAIKTALTLRVHELINMRKDHIDFSNGWWITPGYLRTKTKFIHALIPLEPEVIEWIKEIIDDWSGDSPYVFRNRRNIKRNMSGDTLSRLVREMFENSEFPPDLKVFVPHDLRRTGRTYMSKKGIDYEVAEACLGHKKKGVDDVYNLDDHFDERRAAQRLYLDKITPFINE